MMAAPDDVHSIKCGERAVRVQVEPGKVLRSRQDYKNLCCECSLMICTDDVIWPLPHPSGKSRNRRAWVHLRCAAAALGEPLVPPPCKHYLRSGFCAFGDSCFFAHPPEIAPADGPAPFSEEASRQKGQLKSAQRALPPGAARTRYKYRNRVRNTHRAATIRRWLVATYGGERLARGSGVLEVAGGKGEISFQLVKINGVPATNVDPRPGELSKFRRALELGFYTRNRIFERMDTRASTPAALPAHAEPRLIRAFFEMDTLRPRTPKRLRGRPAQGAAAEAGAGDGAEAAPRALPRFALSAAAWAEQAERARASRWTRRGLQSARAPDAEGGEELLAPECDEGCGCGCEDAHGGGGDDEDDEEEGADGAADRPAAVSSLREAEAILDGASLVVSMHGDAAVDHALEFALQRRLPFVLVPCCVYRELSPWREQVSTYDDLLQHLEAKARSAGVAVARTTLNFEGKNQAIFSLPGALVAS